MLDAPVEPLPWGIVLQMSRRDFEGLVADALDAIPPELASLMSNVVVLVEDEPPEEDPHLLGVYDGVPLTERGEWYGGVLPDRITIFMGPTLRSCMTRRTSSTRCISPSCTRSPTTSASMMCDCTSWGTTEGTGIASATYGEYDDYGDVNRWRNHRRWCVASPVESGR